MRIAMKYRPGSRVSADAVLIKEVRKDGSEGTVYEAVSSLLTAGVRTCVSESGEKLVLTAEEMLAVLEYLQKQREIIRDGYPVKTYKGWMESGLPYFEYYCKPGDEVDEDIVNHFVNSVPPVLLRSSCTQAGEAFSSEPDDGTGRRRTTYTTFHREEGGRWIFDGYCFYGENRNRATVTTGLERAIEWAKGEVRRKKKLSGDLRGEKTRKNAD